MGSSKKKKQVVGYDYFMAAIFGLCLKADKLLKIVYGDRVAWEGQATDQEITVDRADLFGGNSTGGSGGLKGSFVASMGKPDQLPNRVMRKYLGEDVYAHRGLVTLSMDKSYVASFSPQFRTLRCLVRHTAYDWYPDKAVIAGTQINPAHEIRDALINPDLGGQYTADDLDDASFRQAADILYAENFGLSPVWNGTDKTETYIQSLLDCIDGIRTRDRGTGRIRLRLLRGGYAAASLPAIGPGDFSALTDMAAVSLDALVNKITLKYTKLTDTGEESASITQENLANIDMQGGRINAVEVTFEHLTNAIPDLAPRILSRELRARSYPLRSFTLQGKSTLESLEEGDLFVLTYPDMGLERMICRVLEADYGTPDKPTATLTCAEDIFGADMQLIASPSPESAWQTPFAPPSAPTVVRLLELPHYLATSLLDLSADEVNGLPPAAGYLMTLAARPTATDYGYMHKRRTQNGWEDAGTGAFSASILMPGGVGPVDEIWEVGNTAALPLRLDDLAFIDEEIVQITAWTTTALHVRRGVLDTLPQAHEAGARLWLPSNEGGGVCTAQFAAGTSASCVLATYGPGGVVDPARAPSVSLGMNSRLIRPYPPGGLRINGEYLPDEISGPLTVSWRHRDRIEQQDVVVSQTAADIGPEPGTTYTLRVYDENNTLKKTLTGLTGTSWTWETETADCDIRGIEVVWFSMDITNTAATSFSVTLGSDVQAGDMLLAHVLHRDVLVSPDGWTLLTATPPGDSNQALSVFRRLAVSGDAGSTFTWTQASSVRLNVNISAWRHPSGVLVDVSGSHVDDDAQYESVSLPALMPTKHGVAVFAVCNVYTKANGVATYTTTTGNFITPFSGNDLRLAVGSARVEKNTVFNGTISCNLRGDVADAVATSAVALYPADGSMPRQYNRQVCVELESVRDGYTSLQRWNHTVTRPNEVIPDPEPTNLLLAAMTPGTATYGSLTVGIDADGIITLDGTVSGTALNVKYTGGLEINPSRPAAWDSDAAFSSGTGALTQTVSIAGGTFTAGQSDSINVTTRHSISTIFLNCKVGDGIMSAGGTPASPVRMGVIYLRGGTVLNNLKLAVSLTENGE